VNLVDRDRAHLWHPYASVLTESPLYGVVDACGTRLTLEDGRTVVDGMSSWWSAIHGYRHPVLDAALHAQVNRFAHVMFGGLTHAPAVELGELLVAITPDSLTRVFFADSGSVAVEVALKMAVQATGRPRVLTVRGGYHGDTAGAMSVTDPDGMHGLFRGYVVDQVFVSRPRPSYDESCAPEDLAELAAALSRHDFAAVIVEPVVQGAGGMRWYSPDYLRGLVALAHQHGVLVVFDEIATGFGRTGELWGMDHAGAGAAVPDIVCLGKALTGGTMTMGAVLCTDEVADRVCRDGGAFMHGPTFMANALACAVSLASVRLLLAQDWRGTVARISGELRAGLAPARDLPGVADVRVLGAIGVVELEQPCDLAVLQPRLVDEGAWVRPFGKLVYTMPPYVSTAEDVAAVTGAIVRSLA
jgi:adenosylmethionine-8-amino-7-oxononanoate aminotransferase